MSVSALHFCFSFFHFESTITSTIETLFPQKRRKEKNNPPTHHKVLLFGINPHEKQQQKSQTNPGLFKETIGNYKRLKGTTVKK